MTLFDSVFPEQAQASHLRRLLMTNRPGHVRRDAAALPRTGAWMLSSRTRDPSPRVLGALLQRFDEKGVSSRAEVHNAIAELDDVDGVADGRVDVSERRGLGR